MSYIVVEYYVRKYDFVLSDVAHSPLGKKYWKNIIKLAIKNNMNVFVVDKTGKELERISNVNNIEQYYDQKYANCRFKVQK